MKNLLRSRVRPEKRVHLSIARLESKQKARFFSRKSPQNAIRERFAIPCIAERKALLVFDGGEASSGVFGERSGLYICELVPIQLTGARWFGWVTLVQSMIPITRDLPGLARVSLFSSVSSG